MKPEENIVKAVRSVGRWRLEGSKTDLRKKIQYRRVVLWK